MTRAEIEKKALIRAALTALLLLVVFTWKAQAQTVVTGNGVSGAGASGTANTLPKFNSSGVGNSSITDDGTTVTVGDNIFLMPSAGVFKFSTDTAFSRIGANIVGVGTGAQGNVSGMLEGLVYYAMSGASVASKVDGANSLITMRNIGVIGFTNSSTDGNQVPDTAGSRCAQLIYCFGNGTAGDFTGTTKSANAIIAGANGETWTRGSSTELLTIAAAATTDTTGNLLPANSIIEAVVVRVTTVIPTAATFSVGDATTAARFATGVAVAATTTAVGLTHVDQTGAAGPKQTAAAKIRITPNLTPGTATGVVRITVFYRTFVPPTQ